MQCREQVNRARTSVELKKRLNVSIGLLRCGNEREIRQQPISRLVYWYRQTRSQLEEGRIWFNHHGRRQDKKKDDLAEVEESCHRLCENALRPFASPRIGAVVKLNSLLL